VNYTNIATEAELRQYCHSLASAKRIAFDTEFVSEHTYRPVLCLIQVVADDRPAVIDAIAVPDVTSFWEAVAAPGHETIVHAGRGEVDFCIRSINRSPANLIDVQIAAALVGAEYPAGLAALVSKFLGRRPMKHETRTDWRRRPLSKRQIEYALADAACLMPLWDAIREKLEQLGRMSWLEEEMGHWLHAVERSLRHERWRRLAGQASLDPRGLAILRELYHWREAEARRRDQPVRRVLRDDLIVELARRATADVKRISAVRGLERGDLRKRISEIAAAIARGLELPEDECPHRAPAERGSELSTLGQFLFAALGSLCRQAQLAPNFVASPNDIRNWVAYHVAGKKGDSPHLPERPAGCCAQMGAVPFFPPEGRSGKLDPSPSHPAEHVPPLARGWRAEFVGRLLEDVLSGKLSLRVGDPWSDHPLVFEPAE
jgi:ribonuclease D